MSKKKKVNIKKGLKILFMEVIGCIGFDFISLESINAFSDEFPSLSFSVDLKEKIDVVNRRQV